MYVTVQNYGIYNISQLEQKKSCHEINYVFAWAILLLLFFCCKRRVDDFSFFDRSSPFGSVLIEYDCTFSIL